MRKKKSPITFFLNLLLFSFLILPAFSLSQEYTIEDFTAYASTGKIQICTCDTTLDTIIIHNTNPLSLITKAYEIKDGKTNEIIKTEQFPSMYTLSYSGNVKNFLSITEDRFVLAPNEQKSITHFFQAPCKTGKHTLETTITTDTGISKSFKQEIEIIPCQNAELNIITNKVKSNKPCQKANFEIEIQNTGNFKEEYTISLSAEKGKIEYSENPITLEPNQTKRVIISYIPDCSIYGNKTYTLEVKTTKTEITLSTEFKHSIQPDYEYELKTGKAVSLLKNPEAKETEYRKTELEPNFSKHSNEYLICGKEELLIPIKLKNIAEIYNTYNLKFNLPKIAELEQKKNIFQKIFGNSKQKTYLKTDETKYFWIKTTPEEKYGTYPLIITTETEAGKLSKKLELTLTVENCHKPEIKINKKELQIGYEENKIPLHITNTGKYEGEYTFSIVSGPEWLSLETETITINPEKKEETINLISKPSSEIKQGKYKFELLTTTQDKVSYSISEEIYLKKTGITAFLLRHKPWVAVIFLLILIILLITIHSRKRSKEKYHDEETESSLSNLKEAYSEKKAKKIQKPELDKIKSDKTKKPELGTDTIDHQKETAEKTADKEIGNKSMFWKIILLIIAILLIGGAIATIFFYGISEIKETAKTLWNIIKPYLGFILAGLLLILLIIYLAIKKAKETDEWTNELTKKESLTSETKTEKKTKKILEHSKKIQTLEEERKLKQKQREQEKIEKKKAQEELKKQKEKEQKIKYRQSDEYQKKVGTTFFIMLILLFIAAVSASYYYGGTEGFLKEKPLKTPIPSDEGIIDEDTTDISEQEETKHEYKTDEILNAIEDGKYAYDEQDRIIDTTTKRRLSQNEYLQLLRANKENIIQNTELNEEGYQLLIRTIDPAHKEMTELTKNITCDIELREERSRIITFMGVEDPDGSKITFKAESSNNIKAKIINETKAEISSKQGFYGVEEIKITAKDEKGGKTSQTLIVCAYPYEITEYPHPKEKLEQLTEEIKHLWNSQIKYLFLIPYIIAGMITAIVIFLIFNYKKSIMDFLTEDESKPKQKTDKEKPDKEKHNKRKFDKEKLDKEKHNKRKFDKEKLDK